MTNLDNNLYNLEFRFIIIKKYLIRMIFGIKKKIVSKLANNLDELNQMLITE